MKKTGPFLFLDTSGVKMNQFILVDQDKWNVYMKDCPFSYT